MAKMTTVLRRFMRTKLGTIFTLVLCIAVGLFVVNYAGSLLGHAGSGSSVVKTSDLESSPLKGRGLASVDQQSNPRHFALRRQGTGGSMLVCKMPKLTLESDANKEAYYTMPPLQCAGEELFYTQMGSLHINSTVLAGRKIDRCEFRSIEWVNDRFHTYSKTYIRKHEPFDIKVSHDFFRVQCFLDPKHKSKGEMAHEAIGNPARRLLQANSAEEHDDRAIVHKNSPNLVGSFGIPDIADNLLKHQIKTEVKQVEERKVDDEKVENLKAKLESYKLKESQKQLGKEKTQNSVNNKPVEQLAKPNENNNEKKEDKVESSVEDKDVKANEALDEGADDEANIDKDEEGDPFDYNFEDMENAPDFDQFIAQIHVKEDIRERLQRITPSKNALGLNVLIFALDSMSHLSYQRKLPNTYAYLKEVLNSVILNGYNIVGDATTAAMIPLLTGKAETELPEVRVNKVASQYVDIFPFIWNKYEQNGYVTLYAEDQPDIGTFQMRMNGFEQMPVDHYMRPFWQAALESDLHENSAQYCLGAKPEHKYILDYMKQFYMRYRMFPKFSLSFIGELSHADNNPAEYVDEDFVTFLKFLKESKSLDNTLLIVMGDHGARYSKVRGTVQGKLEERLPFMSLTMPQSFQDKYPDLYTNLKRNSRKLTTPFDIHETLRDILDIKRAETPVHYADRGISLFKMIPRNRTCEVAGIDLHWCSCLQSDDIAVTDDEVQAAAKVLVEHLNDLTAKVRVQCEQLKLIEIKDAKVVIPNEQVLKFQKSIDPDQRIANFSKMYNLDVVHHQIIIETSPKGALFEATLKHNIRENKHYVIGEVSRINKYGSQPACILKDHPDLRKYCYCKEDKKSTVVKKIDHISPQKDA